MVVDDSITMRKVTGRVLERHEYEVRPRRTVSMRSKNCTNACRI
jgi:hypothetical protein